MFNRHKIKIQVYLNCVMTIPVNAFSRLSSTSQHYFRDFPMRDSSDSRGNQIPCYKQSFMSHKMGKP